MKRLIDHFDSWILRTDLFSERETQAGFYLSFRAR